MQNPSPTTDTAAAAAAATSVLPHALPATLDLTVMTTILQPLWSAEALQEAAGRCTNHQMMYTVRGLRPLLSEATMFQRKAAFAQLTDPFFQSYGFMLRSEVDRGDILFLVTLPRMSSPLTLSTLTVQQVLQYVFEAALSQARALSNFSNAPLLQINI